MFVGKVYLSTDTWHLLGRSLVQINQATTKITDNFMGRSVFAISLKYLGILIGFYRLKCEIVYRYEILISSTLSY